MNLSAELLAHNTLMLAHNTLMIALLALAEEVASRLGLAPAKPIAAMARALLGYDGG